MPMSKAFQGQAWADTILLATGGPHTKKIECYRRVGDAGHHQQVPAPQGDARYDCVCCCGCICKKDHIVASSTYQCRNVAPCRLHKEEGIAKQSKKGEATSKHRHFLALVAHQAFAKLSLACRSVKLSWPGQDTSPRSHLESRERLRLHELHGQLLLLLPPP